MSHLDHISEVTGVSKAGIITGALFGCVARASGSCRWLEKAPYRAEPGKGAREMTSRRIQRALSATEWANRPIRWAVRLSLGDALFRALRKLPLRALSHGWIKDFAIE